MKCATIGIILVVVAVLIFVLIWVLVVKGCAPRISADLEAYHSDVERWDANTSQKDYVGQGKHRDMYENDGVTVNNSGRAHLDMGGCIIEIFRNSGLIVQELPSQSAQVCILQLERGTLLNQVKKKTIINTEFAVITSLSTEFFVHYDQERGLLWVIVKEGAVEVEVQNRRVIVDEGWQIWIYRGQPPGEPVPATRAEVGDLFPPLDDLMNGEYDDDYLLQSDIDDQALYLAVEQSTDHVYSGECDGDQSMEIYAVLDGSEEALENIGWAILRFQWDGIEEQNYEMKRIEDNEFFGIIESYEYCCDRTTIVYRVEIYNKSGELITSEARRVPLEYCDGDVVTESEPIFLSLEASPEKVYAGECGEPRRLELYANLEGSPESIANVGWATVSFRWEGQDLDTIEMERIDDYLFYAEIDPSDYCCYHTNIVYKVRIFGHDGNLITNQQGEVPLEYCID
ncbi:hypothetical protein ACFLUC_03070 [Chloroflexota bacterium]